jgi:hypothetical protein
MASKFSNLKFIKVKPDSDEETDQFTTSELRRSSRKRFLKDLKLIYCSCFFFLKKKIYIYNSN